MSPSPGNPNETTHDQTTTARVYQTFYVSTTADGGGGSLRQAILDANAACHGNSQLCAIEFLISEPSANAWKTIHVTSPLPALTATSTRIDGGLQTTLIGDTNTAGPEIEISGNGTVDGDGIRLSGCETELANVVVNGFRRNGVSMNAPGAGNRGRNIRLPVLPLFSNLRPMLGIGELVRRCNFPAIWLQRFFRIPFCTGDRSIRPIRR